MRQISYREFYQTDIGEVDRAYFEEYPNKLYVLRPAHPTDFPPQQIPDLDVLQELTTIVYNIAPGYRARISADEVFLSGLNPQEYFNKHVQPLYPFAKPVFAFQPK